MNEVYVKGACCGGALSAEEYDALVSAEESACAVTAEGRTGGCPCHGCHDEDPPVDEGCCCKKSFRAALELLEDEELTELLDLSRAAFLADDYVAGAAVTQRVDEEGPDDNLAAPLRGTLRRFAPCTCDLLDITAALYAAPDTPTGLTADQVSLCELVAVAIELKETEGECCLTAENVAERNFRRVERILARGLDEEEDEDDCNGCVCACTDDCCCAAGIKASLAGSNLSRRVSLAAGPLLLSGVKLLGTVGNVLVLANEEDYRVYFVCVTKVEFLA